EVLWDERGVPHIFADTDADAIRAFGYVIANDRLFQMDFLRRVTAGRLAEVLGPDLVSTDRFLRGTGMARAVSENVRRMEAENGVDFRAASWFAEGVNAYLESLSDRDLPFEFRLLGYSPEPWSARDAFLVGWNLMFDLTFQREGASAMERVRRAMPADQFDLLFPLAAPYSVPIVPAEERHWPDQMASKESPRATGVASLREFEETAVPDGVPMQTEGFFPGKGSNNWAVGGSRSTTGAPVLAGDMHLGLSLPAIWYEVHLVTPEMNTYGVTVPGAPLPIEAFNPDLGWAFTNTGADQIDHLALVLNPSMRQYRYEDGWRDLELAVDTIHVLGAPSVLDTVAWSHWGPVSFANGQAIATQWTALGAVRTFEAIWGMNHARSYTEFEQALRKWDAPMQNVLVAAPGDTIAIRSTGHLPIRADGTGFGVRDGSALESEWVGRVPFDELPHVINPARGYLASTNQRPADLTYPHYMGRNWRSIFRSIRIDQLLNDSETHSVDDVASYQSDRHVVQSDLFIPLLDGLTGLTPQADSYRSALAAWSRVADTDLREPILFSVWQGLLQEMAWDEPVFSSRRPTLARLHELLTDIPDSPWLDRVDTDQVENASALLIASLEAAADSVALQGESWGDAHQLLIRHITGSAALRPLWRGPIPFPGYSQTLSPGSGRTVTHSASWRVVLDLQGDQIVARGIYPGGQSGNPFSSRYDQFVEDYVAFEHYRLNTPSSPESLESDALSILRIRR
ncbi:penicillin acylase family protein, partial [Rhodothermus sp. AH-315-K08]|nr:penicillin acylase family protein [Rhodothermus sp. AH-315-K08]